MTVGQLIFTVSQTDGGYNTRTVEYKKDASSNLVSIVDAAGNTTSLTYKGTDLTSITSVTGAKTTFTYDGTSHKVTRVDQENTTAGSPGTSTTRLAYTSTSQTLVAGPNTDTTAAVTAVPRTISPGTGPQSPHASIRSWMRSISPPSPSRHA